MFFLKKHRNLESSWVSSGMFWFLNTKHLSSTQFIQFQYTYLVTNSFIDFLCKNCAWLVKRRQHYMMTTLSVLVMIKITRSTFSAHLHLWIQYAESFSDIRFLKEIIVNEATAWRSFVQIFHRSKSTDISEFKLS